MIHAELRGQALAHLHHGALRPRVGRVEHAVEMPDLFFGGLHEELEGAQVLDFQPVDDVHGRSSDCQTPGRRNDRPMHLLQLFDLLRCLKTIYKCWRQCRVFLETS
uniref:Uncharacterized protein n=1 Tax=Alexandrium andersonii TaxID=327968 RepID=A0A7S2B0C5_9DINO